MAYRFEWDEKKAKSNFKRHGVRFDEATTVFDDPLARIFDDEPHSDDERREIIRTLGKQSVARCLFHGTPK